MNPETANAAANTMQQGAFLENMIFVGVMLAIVYFFMIRPNKKRMTEYKKMIDSLKVGSRVMAAGIYGTIKSVKENSFEIEISKGVVIEVNKNAVAGLN